MNMHKCKLLIQYIQSPTQAHDVILAWCMKKKKKKITGVKNIIYY